MELNEYDIIVLKELRAYLFKRGSLGRWKKNVIFQGKTRGKDLKSYKGDKGMFAIAKLMFDRLPGLRINFLYNYERMLKMISNSKSTFSWSDSEERFEFWEDMFLGFKNYFRKKYNCD